MNRDLDKNFFQWLATVAATLNTTIEELKFFERFNQDMVYSFKGTHSVDSFKLLIIQRRPET